MGMVLDPDTDLDRLAKEIEAIPTPVFESYGISPRDLNNQGAALQEAEDKRNQVLEDYDASFLGAVWDSWRFNTAFGAVGENVVDSALAGSPETEFDINLSMEEAAKTLQGIDPRTHEYLSKAKNAKHFNMLLENEQDRRDAEFNMQALGVPLSMVATLGAEIFNPVNAAPFMRWAGLAKVNAFGKAAIKGTVQGALNVGEEKAIDAIYNNKSVADYTMAYAFGAGLGAGTSLLSKTDNVTGVKESLDRLDRYADKHLKDSYDEKTFLAKNDPLPVREYTAPDPKEISVKHEIEVLEGNIARAVSSVHIQEALGKVTTDMEALVKKKDTMGEISFKKAQESLAAERVKLAKDLSDFEAKDVTDLTQRLNIAKIELEKLEDVKVEVIPKDSDQPATLLIDQDTDAGVIETIVKLDDEGNIIEPPKVQPSTDAKINLAAEKYDKEGLIKPEKKLPQEYIGLGSMAQSLSRSTNKITRYMNQVLFEHGEKSGFKDFTAALDSSQMVERVFAPYAKSKVTLQAAWLKEAEGLGYKSEDFNKAAIRFIDGNDQFLEGSTKKMNESMAEFAESYKKANGEINKLARESGVEEFSGREDLDDMHLYRSYDVETIHQLTTKHNDGGKAVKATLQEAIRRGKGFEKALKRANKAQGKEVSVEEVTAQMAKAIYNRMLKRATVNTADANLLSSGNQRLLKDMIADADMDQATRDSINYILDTQGRDLRANPMSEQIGMDLSTKVGDIAITDLMHTNFDANFLQKGRYWLGRAALARKGDHFASERAIQESIDAMDKWGTKAGQSAEDIKIDKARLEGGIRMILGQPIENMDSFGTKAMRNVRRMVALSGLGKLGIVQYGEGGRAIAAKGVSQAMAIPEIAKLTKAIAEGKINSKNLKEIEDFSTGQLDARVYMNHPDFRNDEFGAKTNAAEKLLDKMSFFMTKASGWNRVHRMQTAYVMDGLAQKWHRDVMNGTFKKTQMNDLGVTGLDLKALRAQMKKHSTPAEGRSEGSNTVTLNLSKWEPEVRRKFGLMMHRKSKNAVQDIMAGETPLWMNTTMGRFMGQFRSFSVAALAKQTTRDMKMLAQGDIEGAIALEFMLATSTMATLAKIHYESFTKPENERQAYLDEALAMPNLITKVMSYTGSLSGVVDVGSTLSTNLFGVNLAGQRQYRADGISGISPGVQYMDKAVRAVKGIATAPFDGYSKTDANAMISLFPMQTLWGADLITDHAIINNLPE